MTEVYMPPERDGLFRLHVRVSWLNHVVGADIYVQPTTTQVDLTNVPQFQNMSMTEEQAREGVTVHMEGGGGENPQYSVDVVRRLAQHASWVHYETEDTHMTQEFEIERSWWSEGMTGREWCREYGNRGLVVHVQPASQSHALLVSMVSARL